MDERPTTIVYIPDQKWQDNELVAHWVERWNFAEQCRDFKPRAPQRMGLGIAGL